MRRSRISQTFRRRIDYRVGALAIGGTALLVPLGHARPTSTEVHIWLVVVLALFALLRVLKRCLFRGAVGLPRRHN